MATPNKFSNPDVPVGDCLCGYLGCLVTPILSLLCLPCACCAFEKRNRRKQAEQRGETAGPVEDTPTPAPPMIGDAAKPKDQWPEDWHERRGNASERDGERSRGPEEEPTGEKVSHKD